MTSGSSQQVCPRLLQLCFDATFPAAEMQFVFSTVSAPRMPGRTRWRRRLVHWLVRRWHGACLSASIVPSQCLAPPMAPGGLRGVLRER
eukprot:11199027-Alexandrium_andersonii.AAC.1